MTTHRLALLLAVATLAAASPPAAAEDKKSWTGERVMSTKRAKEIHFGDQINGKQVWFAYSGITPTTVREERDGKLRIHDGHTEGWASKSDFVLVNDAPAYFQRRIQADPKDTWALFMRGVGYDAKEEYESAVNDFDKCIRIDPKDASNFVARGNTYSNKNDYDRAIKDYDQAIRLNPKNASVFNMRGLAYAAKNDHDRAIKDYDEAIRLDPKNSHTFHNRGLSHLGKNDYNRAIKDHDEAIRLDPKESLLFDSRGNYYFSRKNHNSAIKDYDEAIRLGNKDANIVNKRAIAQMLVRRPECVKGFQAVLDFQGYKGVGAANTVILGYLAARQVGDEAAAKRFLGDSAGKLGPAWPEPAVRFLRGELDELGLLKLATKDEERAEAHCYLGLHHANHSRPAEALAHYRWVCDHGTPSIFEFNIAVAELDRLDAAAKPAKP